ncbi:hypothetical protein C7449_101712 [Mycoplana dimorpha]|uniref:Uncharacterized protein n=1 Tax=Mycoplana dimorpha TaxID=28320 RepID=A0A2T5BJ77_MYCDI|nr:hypothetical protein C7449_101712 [Mycoplana dimorpha]
MSQVVGAVDQGERKGLREIADLSSGPRTVFLGEKPDVVAEREKPLEQGARIVQPSEQHIFIYPVFYLTPIHSSGSEMPGRIRRRPET